MSARSRVGSYELFAPIASGGFGQVYLARRIGVGGFTRPVALKCLHEGRADDQAVVSMFIDEARIASRITHPNVGSVIDVFEHDRRLWLAMEFIHGEPLSKLLERSSAVGRPIPVPVCLSIALGLLEGLHAAHETTDERGSPLHVVHRDVSPHNIIVSVHGVCKVVDFGIAKSAGRVAVTREGHVKGKLAYMAIEQLSGGIVDRRADVFAAGVVLWEMLAGQRMFDPQDIEDVVNRPDEKAAVARLPRGSPGLRAALQRALAPAPKKRFATAAEMASALEACEPAASPREVAEWLNLLAAPELEQQRSRLEALDAEGPVSVRAAAAPEMVTESAVVVGRRGQPPSVAPPPEVVPDDEPAPPSIRTGVKRYGLAAFVVGGVAALVAIGVLVLALSPPVAAPVSGPTPAASPPATTKGSTDEAAAPSAEPSASLLVDAPPGPLASAEPSALVAPIRNAAPRPPSSTLVRKASGFECDPPYELDARGVKVIKPACVR